MFKPSRDQARQLFFDTWRKYRQREILSGIEDVAYCSIRNTMVFSMMPIDTLIKIIHLRWGTRTPSCI